MSLCSELSGLAPKSGLIKQAAVECGLVDELSDALAKLMKRNLKGINHVIKSCHLMVAIQLIYPPFQVMKSLRHSRVPSIQCFRHSTTLCHHDHWNCYISYISLKASLCCICVTLSHMAFFSHDLSYCKCAGHVSEMCHLRTAPCT